jgi:hypothetical protein
MSKLKWIPMCSRFDIFDAMINQYFFIRDENLKDQAKLLEDIDAYAKASELLISFDASPFYSHGPFRQFLC